MIEEALIQRVRARFFKKVAQEARSARIAAGLTQAQLAERLGTHQSAIARMEADLERGAVSLRRFTDYAEACGMVPLSWMMNDMIPLVWAAMFLEENPDAPPTKNNLLAWNAARIRCGTNVILKPEMWQIDFDGGAS